jgi:hypothetical protein
MLSETRLALPWAEKELEVDFYCVGIDHPHYAAELNMVEKLREAEKAQNLLVRQ